MQYHHDGFRPGDPRVAEPAPDVHIPGGPDADDLPAEVDVLVVGEGPAGLVLAAQLARFGGITTRLVEQRREPLRRGRADGVACRTLEVLAALGVEERVLAESYHVNETTFWGPGGDGGVVRTGRVQDVEDDLSWMPHVILNQARVHDALLASMARSPRRLVPDRGRRLVDLEVAAGSDLEVAAGSDLEVAAGGDPGVATDEDAVTHPVTATLERLGADGEVVGREVVRARYVVGCDGARSTVRDRLGLRLAGRSARQAWGVMDVLAVTDFPDVRRKAAVQSDGHGSLLLIPREGGHMVRLYVELDGLGEGERARDRDVGVDDLLAAAGRILAPYELDVREVAWWSVYEVGQRICERFDDVPPDAPPGRHPRVLIAGDACHTHSPKAGQGMNVSMRDTFNLGWKLAAVLLGRSDPSLLATYGQERRAVAQELIDFDRDFAAAFSGAEDRDAGTGAGGADEAFQDHFTRKGRYTAGVMTRYAPSAITGPATHQALAAGFAVGTRLHSAPVVRLADALPMQLGRALPADGRWRLLAFADTAGVAAGGALDRLCAFLAGDRSPVLRATPPGAATDEVVATLAVLQQDHRSVELGDVPTFLQPRTGALGLVDLLGVHCADPREGHDVFDLRGVDRRRGCLVVVRPDQHVAHLLPLDAHDELAAFLTGVLLPAR